MRPSLPRKFPPLSASAAAACAACWRKFTCRNALRRGFSHNRRMLELGAKLFVAYLLGTVLGRLILGRVRGVDIRSMGSGNAGATNALRTQGKLFGFLVLLIDVAKGIVAVGWLPSAAFPGIGIDAQLSRERLTVACGFAVIVGHVYPVWYEFRGGKGAATVIGVVAGLELRLLVPLLLSWIIVVLVTGYVGLATMLATVA